MKIAVVLAWLSAPVILRRAWDMRRAWRPTWLSPISPSISARGTSAATEAITTLSMAPDRLTGVRLGHEQGVGVDPQIFGVLGVERVLGVDERGDAAELLSVGDRVQGHGGLTAALRAVDLDDAAARETAEAEGDIERDRSGGDDLDGLVPLLAEAHHRALAKLPLDLDERGLKGLVPVDGPLRARPAVRCHGNSLSGSLAI